MANSNTKLTLKDKFNMAIDVITDSDSENKEMLIDFLNERIAKLEKKASSKKPTKNQLGNEIIKQVIVSDVLANGVSLTVTEITNTYNEMNDTEYTPNKISALVKQLVDAKVVVRNEVKKVAYFTLA